MDGRFDDLHNLREIADALSVTVAVVAAINALANLRRRHPGRERRAHGAAHPCFSAATVNSALSLIGDRYFLSSNR
jgi:hypothetical protein